MKESEYLIAATARSHLRDVEGVARDVAVVHDLHAVERVHLRAHVVPFLAHRKKARSIPGKVVGEVKSSIFRFCWTINTYASGMGTMRVRGEVPMVHLFLCR